MNQTRFDFNAWLDTKPDDEKYNYMNVCGGCAVGQFMLARGEKWDMKKYAEYARDICAPERAYVASHFPLASCDTFGELKAALRELEPA